MQRKSPFIFECQEFSLHFSSTCVIGPTTPSCGGIKHGTFPIGPLLKYKLKKYNEDLLCVVQRYTITRKFCNAITSLHAILCCVLEFVCLSVIEARQYSDHVTGGIYQTINEREKNLGQNNGFCDVCALAAILSS